MQNLDIRDYAKTHGVRLWEIADNLKIQDTAFSKQLRKEFDEEKKAHIKNIIDTLSLNANRK